MHSKSIRQGVLLFALAGACVFMGNTSKAAEAQNQIPDVTEVKMESILDKSSLMNSKIPTDTEEVKKDYSDMGFANVDEGSYLFIRTAASKDSEWAGILYRDAAAEIIGPIGEWTQVRSGKVSGYVKTEYLLTGDAAQEKAEELIEKTKQAAPVKEENKEQVDGKMAFEYAVTRAEEEARLAAEEAERKAEEEAKAKAQAQAKAEAEAKAETETAANAKVSNAGRGQAVVDYATQFVGNPYVWGGTSLTNGADCSGFVQSVYAHFGISMPRTSTSMRSAGVEVSYENAQPGDVICYPGHVGIYIGNGQIVNAIDEAHGIGISSATGQTIITVRRMF